MTFMKRKGLISLLALQQFLVWTTFADPFDCGSTGAGGALSITVNTTLNLPPDGILNYTTITVAQGVTLSFNRNALNTPVYLLASGDVLINGTVDVSAAITDCSPNPGKGGPGGFDGGSGGSVMAGQSKGGDGLGPGGGKNRINWGSAAYGSSPPISPANTNTYGNLLLVPMMGGSGGAGSDGSPGVGGAGGGGLF
jgi:hypothetical protein